MTFQPGVSGNPNGRKKERIWRNALDRAVKRAIDGKVDYLAIDALADSIVAQGLAGDVQALKEIGDRIDGKVPQALIGSDDPDDPPLAIGLVELRPVKAIEPPAAPEQVESVPTGEAADNDPAR